MYEALGLARGSGFSELASASFIKDMAASKHRSSAGCVSVGSKFQTARPPSVAAKYDLAESCANFSRDDFRKESTKFTFPAL